MDGEFRGAAFPHDDALRRPQRIGESMRVLDDGFHLSASQMGRLDELNDPRRGTAASIDRHSQIIASEGYRWDPT